MSKIKKALAVVLAAAMVLSCSPAAFAVSGLQKTDGTPYTEGDGYVYGSDAFSNPTFDIYVDTQETTETWRLNNGSGSLYYGNYLTRSSKSGIPESCADTSHIYYATAGEPIENLQVACRIYGVNSVSQISEVAISQTAFSNFTYQLTSSTGTDPTKGSYVKFVWSVTPSNTVCSLGPNANVVFNISFKYAGTTYTAYAYGHTEYIYRPAGMCAYTEGGGSARRKVRQCPLILLYSAQARPDWGGSVSQPRAFANFSDMSQAGTGKLIGMGSENYPASGSGFLLATAETGLDYGTISKKSNHSDNANATVNYQYGTADDGNKAYMTVWMDKYLDHLGTGTDGDLTNGLNMRATVINGEGDDMQWFAVEAIRLQTDATFSGEINSNVTSISGVMAFNQATPFCAFNRAATGTVSVQTLINYYGQQLYGIQNAWSYLKDDDISSDKYVLFRLTGPGLSTSQAATTDGYSISIRTRASNGDENLTTNYWNTSDGGSNSGRSYNTTETNIGFRFRVYTTQFLRFILDGIDQGYLDQYVYGVPAYDGLSTVNGSVSGAAKGKKFPQSWQFTPASWANFKTAYDRARGLIADFSAGIFTSGNPNTYSWVYNNVNTMAIGIEQKNIDAACRDLIQAYNALQAAPAPKLIVHHIATTYDGTTVVAADDEVFTGWDSNGNLTGSASPATPFVNGVSVSLYALSSLLGYQVTGTSSVLGGYLVADSSGSTTYYSSTNEVLGVQGSSSERAAQYTFNYEPANNTLKVFPQNGNPLSINSGIKTGEQPNFAPIIEANGAYARFNFTGLYEGGDINDYSVVGNPIDMNTWKMPYQDTDLYEGWTPKGVELHIATSYGGDVVADTQTPTVITDIATGDLTDVTFTQPAVPTPPSGAMNFVAYYADSNYTVPITSWPITASYDRDAEYPIQEVTSTSVLTPVNNKVTIYALYADLSNMLFFEPQGGTMPTGYESGELTYTQGVPTSYPIPTREGYSFSGWVLEDGTPINSAYAPFAGIITSGAWTVEDADSKTGVSAVEGGTITLSSSTGFICYATWSPNDITLTYRLNIPTSEHSRFNSADSAVNPYFREVVDADTVVTADMLPNNPRRFGYVFNYWTLEGRRFQAGSRTPTTDYTVYAAWAAATDVAFADITSYIKYAGVDEIADEQHGPTIDAAAGDIVNIRFTVCGNFYSGSSSFIFGYNGDFYEKITGVDVFRVNPDNDYISGIAAEVTEIKNYPGTIADYTYSQDETANTQMLMITVDPDVYTMGTYNTVSFRDDEYMIEIKLKIKDTAAQGDLGSVWLALDQLRTADNIMGDLFISFTQNESSLGNVETERVTFDTSPIAATVRLVEEERTPYTLTVMLPADDFGNTGEWADTGKNEALTLTGREGTEILSVTFADNSVYQGFPIPAKTGYTLDGFFAYNTATGAYDENDEWLPGSYATAEQDGKTYAAKWTPTTYTYTFYGSLDGYNSGTPRPNGVVSVVYDQVGVTPNN